MPAPRKLSVASAMITTPMLSVTSTMKVLSTFGRMCVSMMRGGGAAAHLGERHEVALPQDSTSPRMTRAKLAHSSRLIASTKCRGPGPS